MTSNSGRVTTVLGPTNTGKTTYAVARMLGHRTGMIGLPLRLLAREVYDKVRASVGPSEVALITGEERIVPKRARFWICTVEAMPVGNGADFVAVDEIQLCGDMERGHIFTDRLLNARGQIETVFLGSDTMRGIITELIPNSVFRRMDRFSSLSYTGAKKVSRIRPRSAVVGFSVDDVYSIAELIRRKRGGAAVVMGALSPRTRNAQVELYQNGDVDFLVATDAIGMGLNLDIGHVAFSGLTKFDGHEIRKLTPGELAQISGRAGRYRTPGTFGVTGESPPIEAAVVAAIEGNKFAPLRRLQWRNSKLRFHSVGSLIASLEEASGNPLLVKAREANDLSALREISTYADICKRATSPTDVKLLWEVCQIPDFRNVSLEIHLDLLRKLYTYIKDEGFIPDGWLNEQVSRIDSTAGGVDTLSRRIASVRTWTYVAQRGGWVENPKSWRERTRALEDRLSDALHDQLTRRFVDQRTSVLMRHLRNPEISVEKINELGELVIGDQLVGRLDGFRFRQEESSTPDEAKTLRAASQRALTAEYNLRASRFYNTPKTEIDFTDQGGLMWGSHAVGKLVASDDPFAPGIHGFVDEEAGPEVRRKVERRLGAFVQQKIEEHCAQLLALRDDPEIAGQAKGLSYRLVESFGVLKREDVAAEVKSLDQDARKSLRKHGVRFGQYSVYLTTAIKPAATRLRVLLWSLVKKLDEFPTPPPPGLVTIPCDPGVEKDFLKLCGFVAKGDQAIRIDMLERLADMLRGQDGRNGFEATHDMLSISGLSLERFAALMRGIGYSSEKGEREKSQTKKNGNASNHVDTPVEGISEHGIGHDDRKSPSDLKMPEFNEAIQQSVTELHEPSETRQMDSIEPVTSEEIGPELYARGDTGPSTSDDNNSGVQEKPVIKEEKSGKVEFYTFKWVPQAKKERRGSRLKRNDGNGRNRLEDAKPANRAKVRGNAGGLDPKKRGEKKRTRGPAGRKPNKPIDPNNPFAVLAELRSKF